MSCYWSIQLHPRELGWAREKELLNKYNLIGVGDGIDSKQLNLLKKMKIGDIVLVRRGKTPIALVKVIGEIEDRDEDIFENVDWFRYSRKIKILSYAENRDVFPYNRGTLQKFVNKEVKSYKYIEAWCREINSTFLKKQIGLKLGKVYIENFKVLEEFNIDFKSSSIIVIAGVNGSGKTTLMNFLMEFIKDEVNDSKSFVEFTRYDEEKKVSVVDKLDFDSFLEVKMESGKQYKKKSQIAEYYKNHIRYFPSSTDLKDIKFLLPNYIQKLIYNDNLKATEVYKIIREKSTKIFSDLKLFIEFSRRDEDGNLFFKNSEGDEFLIDEISTGEKTLLSKVLYLYLKDIKDSVVLIDEPELSLHPAWQNKILKLYETFAETNNCQVIIATHSPHIIGSAKNENIRLLTGGNGKIEALKYDSPTYGLEFSKILTNVMGVEHLRTPKVSERLEKLKQNIADNKFDTEEFDKDWNDLENILGCDYFDLKLLKLEIAARKKNVPNKQK